MYRLIIQKFNHKITITKCKSFKLKHLNLSLLGRIYQVEKHLFIEIKV